MYSAGFPPGVRSAVLADLNSDGWLDFLELSTTWVNKTASAWLYDPAGASLNPPNVWKRDDRYDPDHDFFLINGAFLDGAELAVLDVNGDGAVDIVGDSVRDRNGAQHPQAFISTSSYSDLIRLVRNGTGGEIAITYESAITQRDLQEGGLEDQAVVHASETGETLGSTIADVVRWTAEPVVSEVRIAGPNREPDAGNSPFGPPTTYHYAHPRFCVMSQSELGFRVVERTRPGG